MSLRLSEALATAADLMADLGYEEVATWSGADEIGLHPKTEDHFRTLRDRLDRLGTSTSTIQRGEFRGEGYELDRIDYQLFSGLDVALYGPHRPASPEGVEG